MTLHLCLISSECGNNVFWKMTQSDVRGFQGPTAGKGGAKAPWKVHQNYIKDLFALKYSSVKDKDLEFV